MSTATKDRPTEACPAGVSGEYQSTDPVADMARMQDALRVIVSVPKAEVLRTEADGEPARRATREPAK
jgi:hypothetical protein